MELVGSCYYTRGVFLNYQQMYFMRCQLFDDEYIPCCALVHWIDSMNVNGRHMVRFIFHCFSLFLFIYLFIIISSIYSFEFLFYF